MREHRTAERWLAVALLLGAVGCGDEAGPAATGGFDKSDSADDDASGGVTSGAGGDPGLGSTSTSTSNAGQSGVGGGGGSATVTGGAGGVAGSGGADGKPFAAKCDADAECASATCHKFGKKGKRCTEACTADTDCPDESAGCSEASVCKLPDGGGK